MQHRHKNSPSQTDTKSKVRTKAFKSDSKIEKGLYEDQDVLYWACLGIQPLEVGRAEANFLYYSSGVGCGDETTSESKPYSVPSLTYGEYNLSAELDVPVDSFDLAVLAGRPGLVEKVNSTFDTLVINVYFRT